MDNKKSTLIKYLFSLVVTLLTMKTTGDATYVFVGLVELSIIIAVSNFILRNNRKVGLVFNSIFLLLYNAQMFVLFFGNSYISVVMLDNLHSVEALGGKTLEYGLAVVLTIIFSVIPIAEIKIPLNIQYSLVTLIGVFCVTLYGIAGMGGVFSKRGIFKFSNSRI